MRTSADRPIFMIGMGRSGTTIISEAISLHEDLGWFSNYLNKLPGFPHITIFDRIVNIPKMGLYLRGKKKQGKGLGASIRRYLPRPEEPYPVLERYCGEKIRWDYLINHTASVDEKDRIIKLVRTVLKLQGKNRLFAKFTGPPRIHYLNSIFTNAYFVHVLRDPRAVVSSLLAVSFWKEGGGLEKPWWHNGLPKPYTQEWIESGRSPAALAAVQWKRVVELAWEEKEIITKERYIEIRYEDFVSEPHGVLRDVFRKLNLNDSPLAHRYLVSIGNVKNMNYKYKKNLTEKDIALVESLTRKIAKQAGYCF